MKANGLILVVVGFAALVCSGCYGSPGRPGPEVVPPSQITDSKLLFADNCAGCHGPEGKGGAAMALNDPVYLAIADDTTIRRIAANGVPGTPMPAFAKSAGGLLTDQQVDAIVSGIRSWARPDALQDATPPAYAAQIGDPHRGAGVYATYCADCHGPDGKGTKKASSIVNGSYLALVSDQHLRTIVIVGRPELGAPDWRGDVPGRHLSSQEISDVVAWIAAQRPQFPGQPYANLSPDGTKGEKQ